MTERVCELRPGVEWCAASVGSGWVKSLWRDLREGGLGILVDRSRRLRRDTVALQIGGKFDTDRCVGEFNMKFWRTIT